MQDSERKRYKNVLIMTAVPIERDAVQRGLERADADGIAVRVAGVGPAAAAASTAAVLAKGSYDLVISAGIGGGYPGRAEIGSIVVSSAIIAADLGAETPDGFSAVDELGFGSARIEVDPELAGRLTDALRNADLAAVQGPALTLSTVTGTAATAERLAARIPGASSEGMEGFGVAAAARQFGIPALELRAVSNPVGPRDRSAWRIPDALQSLERATTILAEVLR
ncbi:futalosine hydrolase [Cohnella thailandensis]|uniref:Futalosine hydrolase n=1 Tax=Cohnella thailandensis TaxID=557557 RepID=A0A841SSU6_9BACL|nr:futalosine hydrolase [Cohnella thailandensis]MBB6633666.1 futalosine hydrolase [Cohnella thailandensis]MBP1976451.1 futalosine hydrolase [Cohnella thailandensis]